MPEEKIRWLLEWEKAMRRFMCNPVRESVFQTLQEKITNKETGDYDAMMISTGDSFTMFPDMVKNQYEKYLNSK